MCGAGAEWMGLKVTGIAGRVTQRVLEVTQGRACGEMLRRAVERLCRGGPLVSSTCLTHLEFVGL